MNDEQLTQRMRAASEAIGMSDAAQARHLEAISAALPSDNVVALSAAAPSRRRRIVASVVAAVVIAPAGLAAASEGSVPGDALYPVKQISERVLVLFDSDVVARHRIQEIEALEAVGRFDTDLYDAARQALTELGENHPLWERLASSTEGADDSDGGEETTTADDDDRSELEPADSATVELVLPDGSKAVLTIAGGELLDVDPPAGWTVTELDDDEATLTADTFEVEVRVRSDGSLDTEISERRDDDTASTGGESEDDGTEADDSAGGDSEGDGADGDGAEEDGSDASDDDVSEDAVTEPSTPSDADGDDVDGSDDEDGEDPEDEGDGSGDDEPSEDV